MIMLLNISYGTIFLIFIMLYIIILLLLNERYYWWYPSINTYLLCFGKPYPNNYYEINIILKDYIFNRNESDINFFNLTDNDIPIAFESIITSNEMKKKDMYKIIMSPKIIDMLMMYKYIYNRARPSQIAPDIINIKNGILLNSKTANTPSYPSGHAFQAYYLGKILSKKFPEKKDIIMKIAKRIGDIRIIAGLHYPSDRDFAYWLVDKLDI
jgi:hypothetical protein